MTGTDLWTMNSATQVNSALGVKKLDKLVVGEKPSYYRLRFHSINSTCLETNMTPLHLRCVVVAM